MSMLFLTATTPDQNTMAAIRRAREWFKIATNNLHSGRNVLLAHNMDIERLDTVLDEVLGLIRSADQVEQQHKEVSRAGTVTKLERADQD